MNKYRYADIIRAINDASDVKQSNPDSNTAFIPLDSLNILKYCTIQYLKDNNIGIKSNKRDYDKELCDFAKNFCENQQDCPKEFADIMAENFWDILA